MSIQYVSVVFYFLMIIGFDFHHFRYNKYLEMLCKGLIQPERLPPTSDTATQHGARVHIQVERDQDGEEIPDETIHEATYDTTNETTEENQNETFNNFYDDRNIFDLFD
eukprot:TCONS_00040660-protein